MSEKQDDKPGSRMTDDARWWDAIIVLPVIVLLGLGLVVGLLAAPIVGGFKLGLEIFEEWGGRKESARAK